MTMRTQVVCDGGCGSVEELGTAQGRWMRLIGLPLGDEKAQVVSEVCPACAARIFPGKLAMAIAPLPIERN